MSGWRDQHVHQWGAWLRIKLISHLKSKRVRYVEIRYCINGWCPFGKYRNGKLNYSARPDRTAR